MMNEQCIEQLYIYSVYVYNYIYVEYMYTIIHNIWCICIQLYICGVLGLCIQLFIYWVYVYNYTYIDTSINTYMGIIIHVRAQL